MVKHRLVTSQAELATAVVRGRVLEKPRLWDRRGASSPVHRLASPRRAPAGLYTTARFVALLSTLCVPPLPSFVRVSVSTMAFVGAASLGATSLLPTPSVAAALTRGRPATVPYAPECRPAPFIMQQAPPSTAGGADLVSSTSTGTEALPLTLANVETVLDELRPYLMADGGNVSVAEIDGATVRLALEGACGSCPSSMMTMKMGIERRLLEAIPEIEEVCQVEPEGPALTPEGVEGVLNEVRPFLNVAGGGIALVKMTPESALPVVRLKMEGSGAAINSVKIEITQRLKRNFPKISQVVFE